MRPNVPPPEGQRPEHPEGGLPRDLRLGPARLTLADVAEEAGVSAAALVQRFGSKRALLLAAAKDAAQGGDYIFPGLRARHSSPVAALLGLADCMALMGTTPAEIAHNLAFLQIDLTDPDFHRHALAASTGTRDGIRALVKDPLRRGTPTVRYGAAGRGPSGDAQRIPAGLGDPSHGQTGGLDPPGPPDRAGPLSTGPARAVRGGPRERSEIESRGGEPRSPAWTSSVRTESLQEILEVHCCFMPHDVSGGKTPPCPRFAFASPHF